MNSKLALLVSLGLIGACSALAQLPSGGGAGFNADLTKLFGDTTAFSAKAEARVLDSQEKELMSMPMDFALLDKNVRVQLDMTQARSKDLTPEMVGMLKQQGLANMVSIVRPDKKLVYLVYPNQKSAVAMPLPKDQAEALQTKSKVEKTALGKEKIDGHDCTKNKLVVTDDKGGKLEAITWNAADLKDFPVQIRTQEQGNTSLIRFKDVKFETPDRKQFDVPEGYTQYKDVTEMMTAIMGKMLDGKK